MKKFIGIKNLPTSKEEVEFSTNQTRARANQILESFKAQKISAGTVIGNKYALYKLLPGIYALETESLKYKSVSHTVITQYSANATGLLLESSSRSPATLPCGDCVMTNTFTNEFGLAALIRHIAPLVDTKWRIKPALYVPDSLKYMETAFHKEVCHPQALSTEELASYNSYLYTEPKRPLKELLRLSQIESIPQNEFLVSHQAGGTQYWFQHESGRVAGYRTNNYEEAVILKELDERIESVALSMKAYNFERSSVQLQDSHHISFKIPKPKAKNYSIDGEIIRDSYIDARAYINDNGTVVVTPYTNHEVILKEEPYVDLEI